MTEDSTLTDELVDRISREHLISTPLEPADLLFVFGTRHGLPKFVETIADLWRRGYFRWALVSGGSTMDIYKDEATVISGLMIEAGVPNDVILTEHNAMNTGENVIFSLPLIDQRVGLLNVGSVIALGKICTSRRYLMTLQRHWPGPRKMLVAINWFDHPEMAGPPGVPSASAFRMAQDRALQGGWLYQRSRLRLEVRDGSLGSVILVGLLPDSRRSPTLTKRPEPPRATLHGR